MAAIYTKFSKLIMETGGSITSPTLWFEGIKVWQDMASMCIDSLLENPKLVKMMDDKVKVDAVITMMSCGYFMAHHFDCPLIPFSPAGPFSLQLKPGLGNPINPLVKQQCSVLACI